MKKAINILILTLISNACSAAEVVCTEDVKLKYSTSGKVEDLKKGQTYTYLAKEPVLISSKDPSTAKMSVLLVPANNTAQIQVTLPSLPAGRCESSEDKQAISPAHLNEYTIQLFNIQRLVGQGKTADAQSQLSALQSKYPEASALEFIAASLDLLQGQREPAMEHLKKGIQQNADYTEAQELLKALTAGKGATK